MQITPSVPEVARPPSEKIRTTRRKRCPRGTRRNKDTGECEAAGNVPVTVLDSRGDMPMVTSIQREVVSRRGATSVRDMAQSVADYPNATFSPEVNRYLVSMKNGLKMAPIFGCGAENVLKPGGKPTYKVFAGYDAKQKPKCVGATSAVDQKILLGNLARSRSIDCTKVIPPLQVKANCWLNSFVMAFIVSDLGRKFFRDLRWSMITGRTPDGQQIAPSSLRSALLVFNACIEAIYGNVGDKPEEVRMVQALDTNTIIERVYKAIERSAYRSKKWGRIGRMGGVAAVGQAGVPVWFYLDLVTFLGRNTTRMTYIRGATLEEIQRATREDLPVTTKGLLEFALRRHTTVKKAYQWEEGTQGGVDPSVSIYKTGSDRSTTPPDVVVLEVGHPSSQQVTETAVGNLKRQRKVRVGEVEYELGGVCIRDYTLRIHYTALLVCGGNQQAFDGAAFTRLVPLKWLEQPYLNRAPSAGGSRRTSRSWRFAHDPRDNQLRYSFDKSYQSLLYFRVS